MSLIQIPNIDRSEGGGAKTDQITSLFDARPIPPQAMPPVLG